MRQNERNYAIWHLFYVGGYTQAAIARRYNISAPRVRDIIRSEQYRYLNERDIVKQVLFNSRVLTWAKNGGSNALESLNKE